MASWLRYLQLEEVPPFLGTSAIYAWSIISRIWRTAAGIGAVAPIQTETEGQAIARNDQGQGQDGVGNEQQKEISKPELKEQHGSDIGQHQTLSKIDEDENEGEDNKDTAKVDSVTQGEETVTTNVTEADKEDKDNAKVKNVTEHDDFPKTPTTTKNDSTNKEMKATENSNDANDKNMADTKAKHIRDMKRADRKRRRNKSKKANKKAREAASTTSAARTTVAHNEIQEAAEAAMRAIRREDWYSGERRRLPMQENAYLEMMRAVVRSAQRAQTIHSREFQHVFDAPGVETGGGGGRGRQQAATEDEGEQQGEED
ncbi:hypothetical protein BD289DRAFT_505914 [Coniella lustricola]|uniref:Uncharacterized protein n=1 Tax=Coniella lustricola TaxID=2025994 RepID=A0A2T3A8J7_9PEZI|nr:hypothetical protein BD289DRAFT_505914 [Coniella lustricola]